MRTYYYTEHMHCTTNNTMDSILQIFKTCIFGNFTTRGHLYSNDASRIW